MRNIAILSTLTVCLMLLTGCDQPSDSASGSGLSKLIAPEPDPAEQAAVVIKNGLRSPDSFQYLSGKVIWNGTYEGNAAYVTLVSYNAQNGFGATLRACAFVAYSLTKDDQVSWNPTFGMQETDRAACELSGNSSEFTNIGKTMAEANFKIEPQSADTDEDNADDTPSVEGASTDENQRAADEVRDTANNAAAVADAVAAEAEE